MFFDRPCSQIDEEIEDDETSNSSLGGSGGNSGLDDDSEMTYVNTIETKQVWYQNGIISYIVRSVRRWKKVQAILSVQYQYYT